MNFFSSTILHLKETYYIFDAEHGIFKLKGTKESIIKNKENDEIEKQLNEKNEKMNDYKEKIKKLNHKLKNLEKVLLLDDKEQQYIHLLGKNQ